MFSFNKPFDPNKRSEDWVAKPCPKRLTIEEVYNNRTGKPDIGILGKHFRKSGPLSEDAALRIIEEGANLLSIEKNVVEVNGEVVVFGEIRGRFNNLMELFNQAGHPKNPTYVFLGNYAADGGTGAECILYLLALKMKYPSSVFLLRGNHDTQRLTRRCGFKSECFLKYSLNVYKAFTRLFNQMPLAAVVNKKYFCVHGGISPHARTISAINQINRNIEPPVSGLMFDLLWSNPHMNFGTELTTSGFVFDVKIGPSVFYTYSACCRFLKINNLKMIIRAHEYQEEGYRLHYKDGYEVDPKVATIFTASNYRDKYNDTGAYMKISLKSDTHGMFKFASPAYHGINPDYNALAETLPFIQNKCLHAINNILKSRKSNVPDICCKKCEVIVFEELISKSRPVAKLARQVQLAMNQTLLGDDFFRTAYERPIPIPAKGRVKQSLLKKLVCGLQSTTKRSGGVKRERKISPVKQLALHVNSIVGKTLLTSQDDAWPAKRERKQSPVEELTHQMQSVMGNRPLTSKDDAVHTDAEMDFLPSTSKKARSTKPPSEHPANDSPVKDYLLCMENTLLTSKDDAVHTDIEMDYLPSTSKNAFPTKPPSEHPANVSPYKKETCIFCKLKPKKARSTKPPSKHPTVDSLVKGSLLCMLTTLLTSRDKAVHADVEMDSLPSTSKNARSTKPPSEHPVNDSPVKDYLLCKENTLLTSKDDAVHGDVEMDFLPSTSKNAGSTKPPSELPDDDSLLRSRCSFYRK